MNQRIKFTYNEAKSKCKDSGGKLAEPSENDNEELKSFQVFTSMFVLPYARHYNPRFVYFLPLFFHKLRFILQTIYVLKNGNSSIFKPKIRGLYTRAVTDQERVIMARVR